MNRRTPTTLHGVGGGKQHAEAKSSFTSVTVVKEGKDDEGNSISNHGSTFSRYAYNMLGQFIYENKRV
jgi:hypothetical protein